jgi:hypothetical protein
MRRRRVTPREISLLPARRCWSCGDLATIAIRRLGLRFHRYFCHACYRPTAAASDRAVGELAKESR